MTLTALVGALVALVARPPEPQRTKDQEEIARLKRRVETLEVEVESLERELAAERNLLTHWIGEASRFAREAREQRERLIRQNYQPQQQLLAQDPQVALNQALQARAAQQHAYAQCNNARNQQQQAFAGFCNCVPSRGQMFDAMVERLNQLGR
jgi:hypothetical protein